MSNESTLERRDQALQRATTGLSAANYIAIFEGFMARGIPEDQIIPRVNVLTFEAWRALKRHVRKGEHGVKVMTWIPMSKLDLETAEQKTFRRPRTTTVFHISQTDPDEPRA